MIDLKKIALTTGIGVVFALFIYFAIDAIAPSPQYNDYCTYDAPRAGPLALPANGCPLLMEETQIADACYRAKGMIRYDYNTTNGCPSTATCDYCSRDFQTANDRYNLRVFWVSAFIGLAAIVLGMYLPLSVEAIASGFMFGGILTLIQSTIRVFGALGRYSRVTILAIELIILVWIGIKKVSDLGKPKKEHHARTQKRLPS